MRDSAGVTIVRASTAGAFISGITTMGAVLDAFAKGGLTTYLDVVKLTKTDGWQLGSSR